MGSKGQSKSALTWTTSRLGAFRPGKPTPSAFRTPLRAPSHPTSQDVLSVSDDPSARASSAVTPSGAWVSPIRRVRQRTRPPASSSSASMRCCSTCCSMTRGRPKALATPSKGSSPSRRPPLNTSVAPSGLAASRRRGPRPRAASSSASRGQTTAARGSARGASAASTTTTATPRRRIASARHKPVGPAPTMRASPSGTGPKSANVTRRLAA